MLSEQEKQKIKLEESYRIEIKKELILNKKASLLTFLNSNFGAFILSTVIVGGISFVYNLHRDKLEKQKIEEIKEEQRVNYRNDLRNELIHRLKVIETINDTLHQFQFSDLQLAYWGVSIAHDSNIKTQYFNFKSFNEKFDRWSLIRVVDELYLVENDKNKSIIKELRNRLNENYETIKFLGEQWKDMTNNGQILGKGKLDFSKGIYAKKEGHIVLQRSDLPLKRIWVNEQPEKTTPLLKATKIAEIALSTY